MLRRTFVLLALLALAAVPAATAAETGVHDDAGNDNRYLSLQLNYAEPDELRRVDGQGLGATLVYGFELDPRWALEARLTGLVLERGEAGGTDFYQQDLGVDAIYRFGSLTGFQPFALMGLSVIRNDVDIPALDDTGFGAHAGIGFVTGPLGDMGLRFRMIARYTHDDYLDGVQDTRIGIGIQLPLGRKSAAGSARADGTVRDDQDGDGVADYQDRCPNSLPYVTSDSSGCMQPNQTIRMYEVTFDNGTSILTSAARAELAELVMALRGQPRLRVRIDGHTDAWGNPAENRRLSMERAEAVATYLALQGIATQRLDVRGFGETRPVESNATEAGRERNRRIEIVLLPPPQH